MPVLFSQNSFVVKISDNKVAGTNVQFHEVSISIPATCGGGTVESDKEGIEGPNLNEICPFYGNQICKVFKCYQPASKSLILQLWVVRCHMRSFNKKTGKILKVVE